MALFARAALAVVIAGAAGYSTLTAIRFARAESLARADTLPALAKASRLAPSNADYHARIATLDAARVDELRIALQLNPRQPSWWIMLAVQQEQDGDIAGSEESLLEANKVCQYYVPRWTLAAFYYRHNNKVAFVRWARAAMSVGYGDSDSLFRMAQRLGMPLEEIARAMVPRYPERLADFLRFALGEHEIRQGYAAAANLIAVGSAADSETVVEACETLFAAGNSEEAIALWNKLVSARWILSKPIALSATDTDLATFASERLHRGFEWKYTVPQGVSVSLADDGSPCLAFSGGQPEQCELVSRYTPMLPGRHYRLAIRERMEEIAPDSGLQWLVLPLSGGRPLTASTTSRRDGESAEQSIDFETPRAETPLRLALRYDRAPGTTRIEGRLWVRSIKLTMLP